jgi:hypothetical protein
MKKSKAGQDYITATGLPVRLLGREGESRVLQSLQTDNRFFVPATYPLKPLKERPSSLELRPAPYKESTRSTLEDRKRPLAPIIDALLLEGGRTMKGLVREVKRRASAACRGKDVGANVRARMYWLRKRRSQVGEGPSRTGIL